MYYTIVLIIAIIIEIILLVIVGRGLTMKNAVPFPNFQNVCPDFWTFDGTVCLPHGVNIPGPAQISASAAHPGVTLVVDPSSLTQSNMIESLDPNTKNWTDVCDKFSWANTNGVYWDGISNNNQCSGSKLPGQA